MRTRMLQLHASTLEAFVACRRGMVAVSASLMLLVSAIAGAAELQVDGIAVAPGSVRLQSPRARQQLLVTGKSKSPDPRAAADLTASAEFSSSDPAIADVDGAGLVIPRGAGQATITVKYGNHQASVVVQVGELAAMEPAPVMVLRRERMAFA